MRAAASMVTALLLAAVACKGTSTPPGDEEETLFHNVCARCHGQDGTGGPPDSLGHAGPRNFTDPAFQRAITDVEIRTTIENGKRGMPAFGAVFTPAQLELMVRHVRKFDPARPHAAASASSVPPSAPSASTSSR